MARWLTLESALTVAPESNAGNFGEMVIVAGPKAGVRFGRVGLHGKLQAGVFRAYGKGFTVFNSGPRTEPAVEAGAVIEIELSPRADLRIDTGRLIVPFGPEPILGGVPPYTRMVGTVRHAVASAGVQFRF